MIRVLEDFRLRDIAQYLRWIGESREEVVVFVSALLLVIVSVLFGGASQANALSQMVVEI